MRSSITLPAGLCAAAIFISAISSPVRFGNSGPADLFMKLPVAGLTRMDSVKTDPETGLVIDDQLMLVKGQCTACHSSRLILQSHFTREKWIERIRWMQKTQNLWDLGDSETPILAYLTKHYGPVQRTFDGRREPLKAVKWRKESD